MGRLYPPLPAHRRGLKAVLAPGLQAPSTSPAAKAAHSGKYSAQGVRPSLPRVTRRMKAGRRAERLGRFPRPGPSEMRLSSSSVSTSLRVQCRGRVGEPNTRVTSGCDQAPRPARRPRGSARRRRRAGSLLLDPLPRARPPAAARLRVHRWRHRPARAGGRADRRAAARGGRSRRPCGGGRGKQQRGRLRGGGRRDGPQPPAACRGSRRSWTPWIAHRIGVVERDITLGPFFTLGVVLVGVAARRRSWLLAAVGVAAIVADQRLPFARRLKESLGEWADRSAAAATAADPPTAQVRARNPDSTVRESP